MLRPLVPGPTNLIAFGEQNLIAGNLAAGYTVVAPDHEGEQLEWTIGCQSGYAALDGIRATRAFLDAPSSVPVGLVGYSGGSVPTQWGGVIPALVVAHQRTYNLDTSTFLSPYGQQVTQAVSSDCIVNFASKYPSLTDASMVKAPYNSLLDVPAVVAAIDDNIMGSQGTPRTPMFLGVGHANALGDTIMITDDVVGLAHEYCGRGVDVTYSQYEGLTHAEAFAPFEGQGLHFLSERFAGLPSRSNCATNPRGNSLAPTPIP